MKQPDDELAIGFDVGGTHAKAVVVDANGRIVARESAPTVDVGQATQSDVIARLGERIRRLQAQIGKPIRHLAFAVPGLASEDERSIAWLPASKLPLEGVNFAEALGWPGIVPVLNDAHAALLGEVWQGSAAGKRNVVLLTLGTGVGGAILSDGRLLRGSMGRAGHLGHIGIGDRSPPSICNMPGSLEEAVGTKSLSRRSGGRFSATADLLEAVQAGDESASAAWDQSVRALAYAIASFINMLDPEVIVISGGIANAGDLLLRPLREHIDAIEWKPRGASVPIVRATLGEWAGAIGAASRAFEAGQDRSASE